MFGFSAVIEKVGDLLAKPNCLDAPIYQRPFAWSREEAGKLLEDVIAAMESTQERDEGEYFLGTMVLIAGGATASPSRLRQWARARRLRVLQVVDGLQRLTTITILLCVLRDLDASKGEPANEQLIDAIQSGQRPRLSFADADEAFDAFFFRYARAPGGTRLKPDGGELAPAEERTLQVRNHFIAALMGYDAAERRRLASFLLDRCCIVQVATTNVDHAYRLFMVLNARGKPLSRDDILKAMLLGDVAAEATARCAKIWELAKARLGEDFEGLFSHIRSTRGRPGNQVILGVNEIAKEQGGAQVFIEEVLGPAAKVFEDLRNARHEGSPHSADIVRHLRYLGWQQSDDWIPPALLWWLRNGHDAAGLARFVRRLDRLAFGIRILSIGGAKRRSKFDAVTAAVRDGTDLDAPDSPLEFTRHELRTIQHNLRDLHERNPGTAKQLLLRLNDSIAGEMVSSTLPADMTVEHVLPRTLRADGPWRDWFPDPEVRELCTESLGNLLLVTKAQNDRAGNLDLTHKLEVYFNARNAPFVALNQDLRGREEWTVNDVKAREAKLLRRIEELWAFTPAPLREQTEDAAKRRSGRRHG